MTNLGEMRFFLFCVAAVLLAACGVNVETTSDTPVSAKCKASVKTAAELAKALEPKDLAEFVYKTVFDCTSAAEWNAAAEQVYFPEEITDGMSKGEVLKLMCTKAGNIDGAPACAKPR